MDETKRKLHIIFFLKEETIDEPVMKSVREQAEKKTELGNEEHLPND